MFYYKKILLWQVLSILIQLKGLIICNFIQNLNNIALIIFQSIYYKNIFHIFRLYTLLLLNLKFLMLIYIISQIFDY